jgi:hypothetical protein
VAVGLVVATVQHERGTEAAAAARPADERAEDPAAQ